MGLGLMTSYEHLIHDYYYTLPLGAYSWALEGPKRAREKYKLKHSKDFYLQARFKEQLTTLFNELFTDTYPYWTRDPNNPDDPGHPLYPDTGLSCDDHGMQWKHKNIDKFMETLKSLEDQ